LEKCLLEEGVRFDRGASIAAAAEQASQLPQ
jgi:hypothetical protein